VDNLTHAFAGVAIFGVWLTGAQVDPFTPVATAAFTASVLGSEAPDADILLRVFRGPVAYLRQHRMYSHSVLVCFLYPLLIASVLSIWFPRQFGLMLLLSGVGVLSHVGLDVLTSYGTLALWPFTKRRFALKILFVFDFVLFLFSVIGTVVGFGFGQVEVAVIVFGGMSVIYIVARALFVSYLQHQVQEGCGAKRRVQVFPTLFPWHFVYALQRRNSTECGRVTLDGRIHKELTITLPTPTPSTEFAWTETDVGRAFYAFAKCPIWHEKKDGNVVRITMADAAFRFYNRFSFSAEVTLTTMPSGRFALVSEGLRAQAVDVRAAFAEVLHDTTEDYPEAVIPRSRNC